MRSIAHLRAEGVAMVNTLRLCPPILSVGVFDYPDDTVGAMRRAGYRVYDLDAGEIARELEDKRLGNTIMLGAIADITCRSTPSSCANRWWRASGPANQRWSRSTNVPSTPGARPRAIVSLRSRRTSVSRSFWLIPSLADIDSSHGGRRLLPPSRWKFKQDAE